MGWRIKTIRIANFKFFHREVPIGVEGRNMLLFGENGTGKSSIYWSLYNHFQAVTKSEAENRKYFTPGHPENLRNRFSTDGDRSIVSIEFFDGNGSSHTMEVSHDRFYPSDATLNKFMTETLTASDFLNYKFLSVLFDFDNSKPNEVFSIFRKHVLPTLTLPGEYILTDGSMSGNGNAEGWLKHLIDNEKSLPKYPVRTNTVDKTTKEYERYQRSLKDFNMLMEAEFGIVFRNANTLLKNYFNEEVEIEFRWERAEFSRKDGGKLKMPKLTLSARMTHAKVKDTSSINHPKSFFNEAKITCMALAIRLAVLNRRAANVSSAGLLCFDDLLISLDSSLRQIVLPMLLAYSRTHQLFIFTHDRSLYNMAIKTIRKHEEDTDDTGKHTGFGKWDRDWYSLQLFACEENGIPTAKSVEHSTHLEKAWTHLRNFRVEECANALRKCCEEQMKRLLPRDLQINEDDKNHTSSEKVLAQLITTFDEYRRKFRLPDAVAPTLDSDRELIMNPFSHDDLDTPYYMRELRLALESMENLSKIQVRSVVVKEKIGDETKLYRLEMVNLGHGSWAEFYFCDKLYVWHYDGVDYVGSPKVKVTAGSGNKKIKNLIRERVELRSLYNAICNSVSLKVSDHPLSLNSIVDLTTGHPLG